MHRLKLLLALMLAALLSGAASAQPPPITTTNAMGLTQIAMLGNGEASDLAFTPDGKLLAVATSIGVIVSETGVPDLADQLSGSEFYALTLDISPDGQRVAAGGQDLSVRVWEIETDTLLLESYQHYGAVNTVAFSPDGAMLASAGEDSRVLLWDAASLTVRTDISGLPAVIDRLAFSPDSTLLAGIGRDGIVRLWDTVTGEEIAVHAARSAALRALAFSPEGLLVFAEESGLITTWDPEIQAVVSEVENFGVPVWDIAVTADARLITVGGDEILRVWAMLTEVVIMERTNQPRNPFRAVAVAGDLIATASAQEVSIWREDSDQPVSRLSLPSAALSAAYSPDGASLAVGTTDGKVTLYETISYTARASLNPEHGAATVLTYLADGRLVAGWEDGFITVIEPRDGTLIASWPVHEGAVRGLTDTGDENVVISAGADAVIRFTNLIKGAGPERSRDDGVPFTALAVDRANRRVAVGSETGTLALFEFEPRRIRPAGRTTLETGLIPTALAIAPDGRTLLVGLSDHSLRLYDLPDMTLAGTITDFPDQPTAIRYGPDGTWVAVTVRDGWLHLFDSQTLAPIFGSPGHTDWATGLALHPSGTAIATTGEDGMVRVWALPLDVEK